MSLNRATVVTVALILILFFAGLGSIPWLSLNEARRAVTASEMHQAGHWLLPTMNGELYVTKPPLFYWVVRVFSEVWGAVTPWSARLPSAFAALACCLILYRLGKRAVGPSAALLAVVMLAANGGFNLFARRAEIEMVLTLLSFGALAAAWQVIFHQGARGWSLLSYALLGAAILTKGPVCLLWVTAPIVLYALVQRDTRAKAYLLDGWGWLLMLAIGGSWFLAVSLDLGFNTWLGIIQEDIGNKIDGSNPEPWYSYLLFLAGDFFPFWIIACVRPRQLWQRIRRDPQLTLLACCALLPLLVFSCFSEKHAKYLLPAYPAAALLLAAHWQALLDAARGKLKPVLQWLPMVMLAGFAVFYLAVEPRVLAHRIDGLAPIARAAAEHPDVPAYAIQEPDMRVVYYLHRPAQRVTPEALLAMVGQPGLLFIEAPLPAALQPLEACQVLKIENWIGKRRPAWLIDLGPACQARLTPKA